MTTEPRVWRPRFGLVVALAFALLASQAAWAAPRRGPAQAQLARIIHRVYDPKHKESLPAFWTISNQNYLSQKEYAQLRDGCMTLLRRYPPDKHFFVGLGRDPAPIIAFLQNLGEKELAVNLPGTSNIHWKTTVKVGDPVVARHIEAAIPEHILKGERKIVILDVSSTGKTPATFGPYIDAYLAKRGNHKKVVRLAFSSENVKKGNTFGRLTAWISTGRFSDFDNYPWGKYQGSWSPRSPTAQGIAEHQGHSMRAGVEPPTETNPAYTQFRQAALARMKQDAKLDRYLATLVPRLPHARVSRPEPPPWPPRLVFKRDGQPAVMTAGAIFTVKNTRPTKRREADEEEAAWTAKQPASYQYLSQAEYVQLREGALAIMRQAPPHKAFYLGVGRSAGPLVAFFENLGQDVAAHLPVDGLHKLANGKGGPNAGRALDALFDAFIPRQALGGARTIVLFQKSETGSALPYLQSALSTYLANKGSSAEVQVLPFAEKNQALGSFIDVSLLPELKRLNDRKYYLVSPYEYFRPGQQGLAKVLGTDGKPVARRQAFASFQRHLLWLMNTDPSLEPHLRILAP